MCGITGIFDTQGQRLVPEAVLGRMNDTHLHRGPDEGSLHLEPGLGLGHRRLSVVDIATSQQPITNEDGTVWLVYNGEIYNYQALRAELVAAGHQFRSKGDSEVIIHAWEQWGERCVERFRGMFAFALFDRKQQTFFMGRDRFGVKPMHYALLPDGMLVFGSELKSVLAYRGERGEAVARDIDPQALEDYFALSYVPEPRTIFRGALKLEPAHTLTIRRGQPVPLPRRYWDLRFSLDQRLDDAEAEEELRRRLREAVAVRMEAEVPLGAFLSGGVDSSAVVQAMADVAGGPVTTCAIGFDDPRFNESAFAQQVATRYGTQHHLDIVGADDHDLVDTLAHLYDEPYADPSALPTYRVSEMARRHVTVALSGDGGDEAFGGYRRYRLHLLEEQMRTRLPLGLRRSLFGTLGRIYPKADWAPRVFRAKTTFEGLARDSVEAYFHSMSRVRAPIRQMLYTPAMQRELGGYTALEVFRRHAARAQTDDPLALVQYIDINTWLVGDVNTKVDRASMAHSLEVREPLMDHELVEWAASLPSSLKIRGGETKHVLKKAMDPRLPADVMYRPKMGFNVPLAAWFRGPLRARSQALLSGPIAQSELIDVRGVRRLLDEHASGLADHSTALWSLTMFDAFLRVTLGLGPSAPVQVPLPAPVRAPVAA